MDLQQYKDLAIEDILEDAAFRKWAEQSADLDAPVFHSYFQQHPSEKYKIQQAIRLYKALKKKPQNQVIPDHRDFTKVLKSTMEQQKDHTPMAIRRYRWPLAIAASLIFLIGIGWWNFSSNSVTQTISWATNFGQWEKITLPDGSLVRLNANSNLQWKGDGSRTLILEGEAFFDVVKNEAPFTVITDELSVEVKGTRFNVNTRQEKTEVFLEEGKVNILLEDEVIALQPDELFTHVQAQRIPQTPVNAQAVEHISWKDGVLSLNNRPLEECLQKIEAIYGKRIIGLSNIEQRTIKTISVPIDNAQTTRTILETVLKKTIVEKDNQWIIQN